MTITPSSPMTNVAHDLLKQPDDRPIPTYGQIPWEQLGRDVMDAMYAKRSDYEFDKNYYPGHQMVPQINFNSLARIVDKYRYCGLLNEVAQRSSAVTVDMAVAEVKLDGAVKRGMMMLDAKNHWHDRALAAEARLAEASAETARCMDMLGDVPGDALEDRLTKLQGWYLEMQILVGTLKHDLEVSQAVNRLSRPVVGQQQDSGADQ